MLIAALAILNFPVYLFLAWLVFDTADNATDTFLETIFCLLRIIFVPAIVREILGWDDSGAIGLLPIAAFLFACGGIVYGEYRLIQMFL